MADCNVKLSHMAAAGADYQSGLALTMPPTDRIDLELGYGEVLVVLHRFGDARSEVNAALSDKAITPDRRQRAAALLGALPTPSPTS
jgi:hypothetical protein